MMKSKNQNNKKRRSTCFKKTVVQQSNGCHVASLLSDTSLTDTLNNTITMEYDTVNNDGNSIIYIYKNVRSYNLFNPINNQINQPLTQIKLKEILDNKNIDYEKTGMYYRIKIKNQLDIEDIDIINNSITLKRCNNCDLSFFLFYVFYDYSKNPVEQDLISTVQINNIMFPSGVDPTKITSISFVDE